MKTIFKEKLRNASKLHQDLWQDKEAVKNLYQF